MTIKCMYCEALATAYMTVGFYINPDTDPEDEETGRIDICDSCYHKCAHLKDLINKVTSS